jgi:CheY-like chemotaxis protein
MEQFEDHDILLIEDNPLDAELTLVGLRENELGLKTTWIADGEQAVDYLFRRGAYTERTGSDPRLILLDLKMPRMDGMEVLKRLKSDERTKRIPVVMMTSSREEADVTRSYDLGVNSYVVKPVDFQVLREVAQQAGFYWLMINRSAL